MRLQNYWWLLIWLFLFGAVSVAFIPKREELVLGKKEVRWNWIAAALMAVPYVIWAGWRPNGFGDTGVYRARFLAVPTTISEAGSYIWEQSKDRGYALIEVVFKTLISPSDIAFFTVIAAIQIGCLVYIYRKYSKNYWLSIFLFVASTDYLSWMHNGMRQFLAATLIFACIPLMAKKKYIAMALVVVLASQIHLSALIVLPFILIVNGRAWNIRTIIFIGGVIVSAFFLDRITGFLADAMEDTAYSGNIEIFLNDDGTNILRVLFYSVPAMMSLLFRPSIDAEDDPLINVCANLAIIAAGFYVFSFFTSGVLIGRLPIYFSLSNYILIPWMLDKVFDRNSALLVEAGFIGTYIIFFYYQVGVTWGRL